MKTQEFTPSWFDVSPEIKQLLLSASKNWDNTDESERYIHQALAESGDDLTVWIAAYRYFFYKNNLPMALQVVRTVVDRLKESEQLPQDWEQIKSIVIKKKEDESIRLFLSAYAAMGLVLARLGDTDSAKEIASRIKEIDDKNEFGGSTVWNILHQPPDEDE
jgi:tetratricopeptide (TPR) repeat protein